MRSIIVKEMMVPIEEYATVRLEATLYEAVLALEKAQMAQIFSIFKYWLMRLNKEYLRFTANRYAII